MNSDDPSTIVHSELLEDRESYRHYIVISGKQFDWPLRDKDRQNAAEACGEEILEQSDRWTQRFAAEVPALERELEVQKAAGLYVWPLQQRLIHARQCEVRTRPKAVRRPAGVRAVVRRRDIRPHSRTSHVGSNRHSNKGAPDDDGGDPEPAGHRICQCPGCNEPIPLEENGRKVRADRKFHSDACKQAVHEGRVAPAVSVDPYLRHDRPGDLTTREAVEQRTKAACRCNGHHVLDPTDGDCIKCGHPYTAVAPYYLAVWARNKRGSGYLQAQRFHPERVAA